MDEEPTKQWILQRLKESLQALAVQPSHQVRLFPDFVVKTDELVLDFDHWWSCAIGNYRNELTAEQLACLENINSQIDTATTGDRSIWDEAALQSHPYWSRLRELAQKCLKEFGWECETPPGHPEEYVGTEIK